MRSTQLSLPFDFDDRQVHSAPTAESPTCRKDRVYMRNRLLTARYYYWTEIRRRRFDDVLKILSNREFFVEERTITNALGEQDEFFSQMIRERWATKRLRSTFPGFDWSATQ